jgi:hypothetical protein
MEEIGCFGVVEALVQQPTPPHFVKRSAVSRSCRDAELFVSLIPFFDSPETFSAEV